MAKKTRKKAAASAAKAAKTAKAPARKKGAAANKRKVAARKKSTAVARKPAGKKAGKSLLKTIEHKVADAVMAVVDTLTEAERLHHQMEPGVPRNPK